MKFYPSAISIVLGTSALSPSTVLAFLQTPPHTISKLSIPHSIDRYNNNKRSSPSSSSLSSNNSIISALAFYPSDEPLSERLKNVQTEFDNIIHKENGGITKFFADELEAAERIIQGNAHKAEKGAEDVIARGESDSDYLLKDGFQAMAETGKKLAHEIFEVRQEFDELKAAKIVEEAAQDVVSTDVMVEKDLEKVVQSVVASLEEAEEVVQSAIATVASKEGLTDAARAELTDKLEAKAQNIEEKIKVADSVARTAKQIAVEDEKVIKELEKTGDRLSSAIDATEKLTETLKGTEGGAALDAISTTVDQTASIVKEDLSAAESIADAVGQKVVLEAEAVMELNDQAGGSVKAVRAAKDSIQESSSGDAERLTSALSKDAAEIKVDTNTAEKLAEAIQQDAANDEEALEVLERSSEEVNELINAVDDAVDKASDAVDGEISASSIKEAVDKIENEVKEVKEELTNVEEAAEKCEDCKVKEVKEEMESKIASEKAVDDAEVSKGEEVVESKSKSEVENPKSEEELVSKGPDEKVEDSDILEGKHDEPVLEANEVSESQPDELLAKSESEPKIKEETTETITTASAGDTDSLEIESVGETETPEVTTLASAENDGVESSGDAIASNADSGAHHASESVSDAVEMASNSINGEALSDVLTNAEPPEGLSNVVADAGSALIESISSSPDAAPDAVATATNTLTEAAAVLSSFFL